MATTVTSKGQVTIPKTMRDRLGIIPGSKVEFDLASDGRIALSKSNRKKPAGRFEKLRGAAGGGLTTDEIMALLRGDD